MIAYGFSPFGLGPNSMKQLKDIAVFSVVKDLFLEDVTGLVFAGFGSDDRYPVCVTYLLSAIVGGIVKRGIASVDTIDTETRSKIRMFADSEVTHAFIRGIDYGLERRVYGAMSMMLHSVVDQVIAAIPEYRSGPARQCAPQVPDGTRAAISGCIPRHDRRLSAAGLYQPGAARAGDRSASANWPIRRGNL